MRVCGYVRVSTLDQVEQYSLPAQEEAIARYAAAQGWTVATLFRDEGISAFTDDPQARPGFARLMAEIDARQWDVVIVAKQDRFARSVIVATSQLKRILAAKATLIDVSSQINYATTTGQFVFGIQSLIAENESRQISDRIIAAIATKRGRGGYHGMVPFGARYGPDGALTIDPAQSEHLRLLLTLRATHSDEATAAALTRAGIRSRGGNTYWYPSSVRSVVRSGRWLLAQEPPWPDLWLAARQRPRLPRVAQPAAIHLLTGLMQCSCGGRLSYSGGSRWPDGRRRPGLQCRHLADPTRANGLHCRHRRHYADYYEDRVTAIFLALRLRADVATDGPDARSIADALADLGRRRRILWLGLDQGALSMEEYESRRRALDDEEAHLPRPGRAADALVAELTRAQATWPALTDQARNAILRLFVGRIVITGDDATVEWVSDVARCIVERQ